MSIATEISRLQTAKSDLKTAIEAKGVTVPSATTIDGYATLVGQIQTGATEAPENDVNFYDYDGFRVASFTIAEAKALTQAEYNAILPPTHEGLTFQEWNWTWNDITTYNRQYIDIGANYITTDSKAHLHCKITSKDVFISFSASAQTVYIDWGDGSAEDSYAYGSSSSRNTFTHTYSNIGEYTIKTRSSNDNGFYDMSMDVTKWSLNVIVEEINCDKNISFNTNYALAYNPKIIISITKDTTVTPIRGFMKTTCPIIVIPRNAIDYASTGYNTFNQLNGRISFPKQVKKIFSQSSFSQMVTNKLVIPEISDTYTANNDSLSNNFYMEYLSIPSSFQFASSVTSYFTGNSNLKSLDIVQGWIPTYSMTINQSTRWTADSMVDFFTKLGTTTNTITLTFGSTNLDKLTADQKAIATNKGYTLA